MAIVQYLHAQREANVGEIARAIGLSFRATSRHLHVLRNANLVEKTQRDLFMIYRIPDLLSDEAQHVLKLLIG